MTSAHKNRRTLFCDVEERKLVKFIPQWEPSDPQKLRRDKPSGKKIMLQYDSAYPHTIVLCAERVEMKGLKLLRH